MTRMVRLTLVAAMLIVTLMALAGPTGVSNNSTLAATRPLDLVILIDTTGSMGDDIDAVKARSSEIVNSILGDFPNARIAVIDYRDFPEWTAWEEDYPYRDVQRFSSNATEINNSINTLELGYGGDWPESLWCALMHAMVNDGCAGKGAATTIADADGVGWRSDARKAIIYLTDAPAHDPEPYTDFTIASVQSAAASGGFEVTSSAATTRKLAAVDSGISLFPVIIGGDSEAVEQGEGLAAATGGKVFSAESADEVVDAILEAVGDIDVTPPVINLPGNITQGASPPPGVAVTYAVSATDAVDGDVPVNCVPPSGSVFQLGATVVTCSATDNSGNTAIASFTVTVTVGEAPPQPAFQRTWSRTDQPVANDVVDRTWIWGPAFTGVFWEPYADAPGGWRMVQYYEKSRMEITDPGAVDDGLWYVTNGLLVREMVEGRRQEGHNTFVTVEPAHVNVAGDPDDPNGPTYATFAGVLNAPPLGENAPIIQRIDRNGVVTEDGSLAGYGVTAAHRETREGLDHRVASVFWDFLWAEGPIMVDDVLSEGLLFANPFYATGLPITEAYWATVRVGGTERLVLVQCFERRCLTYSPDNPEGWQIEMGNVGSHYFIWRYGYHPSWGS